jgi:hypothetical protein
VSPARLIKTVDLHSNRTEIGRFGGNDGQSHFVDSSGFGEQLGKYVCAVLQLDECRCNVGADAVMTA